MKQLNYKRKILLLVASLGMFSLGISQPNPHILGINPQCPSDYSSDYAFCDVMISARQWQSGTSYSSNGLPAQVDINGWPTENAVNCIVWAGIEHMNGTYLLSLKGKADTIKLGFGSASLNDVVYNPVTNTTTAQLIYSDTTADGLDLGFYVVGGVKDVHLMRPTSISGTSSYDSTSFFTTPYLNLFSHFKTIRFMDFASTNGSNDSLWSNRTPMNYHWSSLNTANYGWQGRPFPWEMMIQLCNLTKCNAWINIPAKATEDYVTQLATLWKNNLDTSLCVYVEYSNEVWNSGFNQFSTNYIAANQEVATGTSELNFDGETNTYYWAWRRVAEQIVQISNLWRTVWGDSKMITKIRPVLMWQQGDAQSTAEEQLILLDYISQSNNKPISYYLYGAGGSAYYNPDNTSDSLTLDNIWSSASFDTAVWSPNMKIDAFYSTIIGGHRVAYEGGPSMDNVGHSESIKSLAVDDPRMENCVLNHQTVWDQNGGELLCYYQSTGDYQWGFAHTVYNLNTPKYSAISVLDTAKANPISLGLSIPFAVDGNAFDRAKVGWVSPGSGEYNFKSSGDWVGFLFNVTSSGSYMTKFDFENASANQTNVAINLDGYDVGNQTLSNSSATSVPLGLNNLNPGLHCLRIRQNNEYGFSLMKVYVYDTNAQIPIKVDSSEFAFSIYPNPSNDHVNLEFNVQNSGKTCIGLYDLSGKLVSKIDPQFLPIGKTVIQMNTASIGNGTYLIQVQFGEVYNTTKKVVIIH